MSRQCMGLEHACCCCMLLIFVLIVKARATQESCLLEQKNWARGVPEIKFPFWAMDDNHSIRYPPGFGLSRIRDPQNRTLLQLDSVLPAKMLVESIDYDNHRIFLYAADGCLPGQLLHINLSAASPFRIAPLCNGYNPHVFNNEHQCYAYPYYDDIDESGYNITLFTCPASKHRGTSISSYVIDCLNGRDYQVYALPSSSYLGEHNLRNCKKTGTTTLNGPLYELLFAELPDFYSIERRASLTCRRLQLTWFVRDCQKCEDVGQSCRLEKNGAIPETQCYQNPTQQSNGAVAKLKEAGYILGPLLLVLIGVAAYRINKKESQNLAKIKSFLEDYRALKPTRYSYADIKRITGQFKEKVGQGGFGTVYKGNLSNEITVAVKILNNTTGDGEEFINEVKTMGRIHHVNVVRLVGFCADGYRRALVYEFLRNESLDKFIYSEAIKKALGWKKLKDIALGTAKGIEYLHQGCQQRILHFDIKPHNVLLDGNLNPKISDFGLAKLCSKEQSLVSLTAARGTIGYIAPEVVSRNFGNVSHKSDVYSFGMLLVNMAEGRKKNDAPAEENSSQGYFPDWIYARLERGEVVGTGIDTAADAHIAKQLIVVGLSCIQWYPGDRPSMKEVVQMLQGEGDGLTMPPNPFAPTNPTTGGMTQRGKDLNMKLEAISETDC